MLTSTIFLAPSSSELAGSMWELILTFCNYPTSTTFPTPAVTVDLPLPICPLQHMLLQSGSSLDHLVGSLSREQHYPKATNIIFATPSGQPWPGPVSLQSTSCPRKGELALPISMSTVATARPLSQLYEGQALPTSTCSSQSQSSQTA